MSKDSSKMPTRGRVIAAARVLAGMGVRDLAESAGLSQATVVKIEQLDPIELGETRRDRGKVMPETLDAILGALLAQGVEVMGDSVNGGQGARYVR